MKARHVVGCVPYINAKPLVRALQDSDGVSVLFDVPSKLPALLESGGAEAVLASSFDALSTPGRTYVEGIAIASTGPVESVRLLSEVPFSQIQTLALDSSSLTSNHLARILLAELHDCRPVCSLEPPDAGSMLGRFDAAVLIGDKGMAAEGSGLYEMDLGLAWFQHTGLPFVWALWIGNFELSGELCELLRKASDWGVAHLELIATESAKANGMPVERCLNYLSRTMQYRLTDAHLQGLLRYRDILSEHGFVEEGLFPEGR